MFPILFPGGLAQNAEVEIYSTPGSFTWNKPAGAKFVSVLLVGGGGGGGSGRRGAPGTPRTGGGGGGGAQRTTGIVDATTLPSTVSVTIGAGGLGASAQTVNDTDGFNAPGPGGDSIFGTYLIARPGFGGVGGKFGAAGTGGVAGFALSSPGGSSNVNGDTGGDTASPQDGCAGGGCGGGITVANVATGGGGSYDPFDRKPYTRNPGGAPGVPGNPGADRLLPGINGQAGTGGGSILGAAGKPGGTGGKFGGGGGGGSASENGFDSGAGGAGGSGLVIVTTFF